MLENVMYNIRIHDITRELFQSGRINYGEAIAISFAIRKYYPSTDDIEKGGTIILEGLSTLRGKLEV